MALEVFNAGCEVEQGRGNSSQYWDALLASGLFAVTALGIAWVIAQAVTVVLLAEAQWMGLRATRRAARPALA